MPWKSDQQRKWGHTVAGKKALGGEAGVREWDEATKGKKLPEKIGKSELPKTPKLGSALGSTLGNQMGSPKDVSKVGKQSISAKMPKAKGPTNAFAPPSVFFKSETGGPKHPSLRNLWDFMNKKHKSK